MARGNDRDNNRVEDIERRTSMQEREMIVLADTIKELAGQVQHLAESQVQIIDSHDDLLQKIIDLDRKLNELTQEQ